MSGHRQAAPTPSGDREKRPFGRETAGVALEALEASLGREVALEADRGFAPGQYDIVLD